MDGMLFLFEIDAEYYRLAKERLDRVTAQVGMFDFMDL